jgi:cysteine desulfuration protein SufE
MPIQSSFDSCLRRQLGIRNLFNGCLTPESKYGKIIELGRQLTSFPHELKTPERLVRGCQNEMYLASSMSAGGTMQFLAYSEALISAGLAALLILAYHDESPEAILGCPPAFLEDLGIHGSLSPGRSNGLSSLFLRMKQEALNFLIVTQQKH